jgi:hypothetical protein
MTLPKVSVPIPTRDHILLIEMQRLLDEAYDHYFSRGGSHCKSQEGYIALHFNNYHDRKGGTYFHKEPEPFRIARVDVYSYVLGPVRMHVFTSVQEALDEVRKWHDEEMKVVRHDG